MIHRTLFSLIMTLLFIFGCSTTPSPTEGTSIDMNLVEGVWRGSINSDLATPGMICNLDGSLSFEVEDGIVTKVWGGKYRVQAPVRSDGYIVVTVPDVMHVTRQETFTDYKTDLIFYGWLTKDKVSEGRWKSDGCRGDWNASLIYSPSNAMRKVDEYNRKLYDSSQLPHSILISMTDVVWEYGKKNFVVYEGDILEVLSREICRSGSGECWKVRHIRTNEIGYVRAMEMRSRHKLLLD